MGEEKLYFPLWKSVKPQKAALGQSVTYLQDRSCQQKFAIANCFRNFSKKRFKENCYQKNREEIANVTKIAKVTGIFLAK